MAETIKGINVVIGAETTGLQKALSDVNNKSRDIQSELKQVEKLLKLDPTNTELLAQKQKLLGDAVNNTKEKLDRLKAAQEQVNRQFQEGRISEGQYRAFQREVAKTEQELRSLESRLQQTGKATDSFGDKLAQASDKMSGIGKTMTAAVTAPILAAGGLLLKSAADAETAQGKLQASLGLTAEEAEKLGEVAREVWKDGFGENIGEVSQAIADVRRNMAGLAESELPQVAEGAMTIAQVFGQDVREVTATAGVMMKNFGISGQEAMDIITAGFQRGGDFSGELLDTLREYSPQFKSLGLEADQAMAMLIAGAEAGAWNLDKVGDAMKEFNIRAQDGSKTTAEGFAAIELNAEQMSAAIAAGGDKAQQAFFATVTALANMDDPLKQNIAGVALFGTQWEDVRSKVITALQEGKNGLGEFKGATEEATAAMRENNPMLAITQAMRELQDAIGPALLPLADIISNTIVPAVKSLAEWFASLSPAGQKVVLAVAGIAAAIGPLLIVLGSVISAVGTITTFLPVLGTAFSALTGPVGIAIAAITALAGIAIVVIKNWEPIKGFFINLWENVKTVTASAVEWMKGLPDRMAEIGRNLIEGLWNGINSLANWIKEKVTGFVSGISSTIKEFFGIHSPSTLMTEYGEYIGEGLAVGIESKMDRVQAVAEQVAKTVTAQIDKAKSALDNWLDSEAGRRTTEAVNRARRGSLPEGPPVGSDEYRRLHPDMPEGIGGGKKETTSAPLIGTLNVNSPKPLTPVEVARETTKTLKSLSVSWGLIR